MYKLNTPADADSFVARLVHVIARKMPMTITYVKDDGTVTVRTVEPYDIDVSAEGNPLMRTLDRATGTPRTFRMDRISTYTPHRSARVLEHTK